MPLPPDPMFWENEARILADIMRPWIEKSTLKGIEEGRILLGDASLGITIDWDLVNDYARAWAIAHTATVVAQITETSMTAFVNAFPDWVASGEHLNVLIAELAKHYEPWRAEMIAVTETTRAFTQGNHVYWGATGVVDGTQWMTGEDELVCPLCLPLDGTKADIGQPYPDGSEGPPRHVKCRCYERPVVNDKVPKPLPTP